MATTEARLKPGDKASVPLSGLCRVKQVQETELLGEMHTVYVLEAEDKDYTLKVPAGSLAKRGIRPLMPPEKMEELLETRPQPEPPEGRPHRMLADWTARLREGEPGVRTEVLTELAALKRREGKLDKDHRQLMNTVRTNLRREIEEVLDLNPSMAGRRINQLLQRSASKKA